MVATIYNQSTYIYIYILKSTLAYQPKAMARTRVPIGQMHINFICEKGQFTSIDMDTDGRERD